MSLLFMDGFDHYVSADIAKKWTSKGTSTTVQTTSGRRGGGCLWSSGNSAYLASKTIPSTSSFVIGFALYTLAHSNNATRLCALQQSSTAQCELYLGIDGTLRVGRNGTVVATSSLAIPLLQWVYVEWKFTIADSISANSCIVRVNGVDWINAAAGIDLKNHSTLATANELLLGSLSIGGGEIRQDDFYLCDQSGSVNNDFLGDVRIDTLYPNGDGNYSQFTPSTGTTHYTLVDETAPNTTDYVDGTNVGDRDSYALQDLAALASQTIYAVQVNAAVAKDDAGAKNASTFVRHGGTNGDGASAALGTSQAYISQVYETNPNGGGAWTESAVNGMEAGVRVTA